ncbi:hypothetical protein WOLCODRAFT_143540 [Wolfiporia cocos MD-104 SS10]|uniref:Complex 1 LYR protein n=1 Tax=Wolfiporia cocos (strain MD-104) TaxID=742152 RepID=A0A2H3JU78_WOLCO|nr:hypothetical protein WOLCODRAFT_143540 [Wolfiporia cocos MD-104 SS10]
MADRRHLYRALLRESVRASIAPRATRPHTIAASFRALFAHDAAEHFDHDIQNAVTFMRSQRTHKELLDRYNPLHDLTTEERIRATARRVGLNMPIAPDGEGEK